MIVTIRNWNRYQRRAHRAGDDGGWLRWVRLQVTYHEDYPLNQNPHAFALWPLLLARSSKGFGVLVIKSEAHAKELFRPLLPLVRWRAALDFLAQHQFVEIKEDIPIGAHEGEKGVQDRTGQDRIGEYLPLRGGVENEVALRGGWTGRALDLWTETMGSVSAGRLGKALKPLVEKYGEEIVLGTLTYALKGTSASRRFFKTPETFASSFEEFKESAQAFDVTLNYAQRPLMG